MAIRSEVLSLYKTILRTGRRWVALNPQDTVEESSYIISEAKELFRQNKHVRHPTAVLAFGHHSLEQFVCNYQCSQGSRWVSSKKSEKHTILSSRWGHKRLLHKSKTIHVCSCKGMWGSSPRKYLASGLQIVHCSAILGHFAPKPHPT